jgi:hypothetical protein
VYALRGSTGTLRSCAQRRQYWSAPKGPQPEPYFRELPGRGAIIEGQVFVVAFIFIAQLWLVTEALYQLLSGQRGAFGWIALASFLGFVIALVVWRWPRHHISN